MSPSVREVYGLARSAGLNHNRAVTATAIALGESGLNPAAVGDTSLTDATWGPSVGLWQVRSLNAERGTGKTRDETRLSDPTFNARAMYEISQGGRSWSPWTVYSTGAYKAHLDDVTAAVGESDGGGFFPGLPDVGDLPFMPDVPDLPGLVPDLPGLPSAGDVRGLVLTAVVVAGGLAVVVVGVAAATGARDRMPAVMPGFGGKS